MNKQTCMWEKIKQIEYIKSKQIELSIMEANVAKPILTDLSMIGTIFQWFLELNGGMFEVYDRKKFIFIVLYLYSPIALAGGKISNGIISEISKLFNVSRSSISHNAADVGFLYQNYRDFSIQIDYLYSVIVSKVEEV